MGFDKNELLLSVMRCSRIPWVAMNFSKTDVVVSDFYFDTVYISTHLIK